MIELWRNTPTAAKGTTPAPLFDHIFASGRQALTQALRNAGANRSSLWGIHDYASACVITAVAKAATNLPFTTNASLNGILIYSQWGWEKSEQARAEVRKLGIPILWDRVDTLCKSLKEYERFDLRENESQIVSLSKTVGLFSGGLLWSSKTGLNKPSKVTPEGVQKKMNDTLENTPFLKNLFKDEIPFLASLTEKWLKENSLESALETEFSARMKNLSALKERHTILPQWMQSQIESAQAMPGIFPLFSKDIESARNSASEILKKTGIAATAYHFDISDSWLNPKWVPCTAIPLHGEVNADQIKEILKCHRS